jgi:hypothetical protein
VVRARVVEALDLVEHASHFELVVFARVARVIGSLYPARHPVRGRRRVDLGRIKLIDARPGRPVEDLVSRVLVRPRRAHAGRVDDFHDRVDLNELVRIHGNRPTRFPYLQAPRPTTVEVSMLSRRTRAWSVVSSGVLPRLRTRSRIPSSTGSNQSKRPQEVSIAGCENSGFVITLIMAWSPSRRSYAGDSRFDHPGDYATFNSNHIPDRTR